MNVTVMDRQPDISSQTKLGIVDCDVHPYTKSGADLDQFLSERWRKHRASIGGRSRAPFSNAPNYPDRKSTRLNSSHRALSRMPSSA